MLNSVPRSVWILQHASDDVAENRVVVTCSKNNDGKDLGPRSVWSRDNGIWSRYEDEFDWDQWDNPGQEQKQGTITEAAVASVLRDRDINLEDAVIELMELTGLKRSACYKAFDFKGKFKAHLRYDSRKKTIKWV